MGCGNAPTLKSELMPWKSILRPLLIDQEVGVAVISIIPCGGLRYGDWSIFQGHGLGFATAYLAGTNVKIPEYSKHFTSRIHSVCWMYMVHVCLPMPGVPHIAV